MFHKTLVPRNEYMLAEGAAIALWCGLLLRLLWNLLVTGNLSLMDAQLFWGLALIGLIYAWGSLVPRGASLAGLAIAGGAGWLAAVTIAAVVPCWAINWLADALTGMTIPWLTELRYIWWQVPFLGQPYPLWVKCLGGAILLAGIILRSRAQRRAMKTVLSGGHERTLTWAEYRPLYCRITVKRVLRSRGVDC